jgi:hypothetical protein
MAALAPAPVFAAVGSQGSIVAHKLIARSAEVMALRKSDRRILLVGGTPKAVNIFREAGLRAFGALVDDHPGVTPFHAVSDAGNLAFQSGMFHSVYWSLENPLQETMFRELLDALRLVEAGGLFLFDDKEYPYWPGYMKGRNWVRVCFRLAQFSIWERRDIGDTYKYKRRMATSA